jgi:hypothetical protein
MMAKQPARQATLFRSSYVKDGQIHFVDKDVVEYFRVMGRMPPEPWDEPVAKLQWSYRNRRQGDPVELAKAPKSLEVSP